MSASFSVQSELKLSQARIQTVAIDHPGPDEHYFDVPGVYWVDLCLTPRRPLARGRYADRWGPHRFASLGSIMSLPSGFPLQLRNEGGQHFSIICAIQSNAVEKWLPSDFAWTDRRLEACLDISNSTIREILLRFSRELRYPDKATMAVGEALITQLAVELGRFLVAIDDSVEQGGLADWRQKLIDRRLDQAGPLPTLAELAKLCGLSERQLTRGFRTSRGCSVGDHLRQTRIDAAKRSLATDQSIKAIASASGFSSQSTFTFAFRAATGVTPKQFRDRIAKRLTGEL